MSSDGPRAQVEHAAAHNRLVSLGEDHLHQATADVRHFRAAQSHDLLFGLRFGGGDLSGLANDGVHD
jgi:hypothetical protein